jgi:hypothetical protein
MKENLDYMEYARRRAVRLSDEGDYLGAAVIERTRQRVLDLEEVIKYTLKIGDRCHGDDYSYDDCWDKMQEIIKERE